MKTKLALILPAFAVFLASAVPANAALVLGGDFQPYKPGSTSVTAAITGGWVPWPSTVANPIDPNSLTPTGGNTANYSDSTSGTMVDFLGWTKPQGGGDFVENGIGGSMALNLFAAWGGPIRPIVDTTGSLHTIGADEIITISTMVGGPLGGPKSGDFFFSLYAGATEIVPSSVVDQILPLDNGFQMISRTYYPAALAPYIGQSARIRIAIPNSNNIANRIIFDDVSLTVIPEPSAPLLLGLGGVLLAFSRSRSRKNWLCGKSGE